jgi:hypothetical protein
MRIMRLRASAISPEPGLRRRQGPALCGAFAFSGGAIPRTSFFQEKISLWPTSQRDLFIQGKLSSSLIETNTTR